jgi:hypothetical protein
VLLLLLLPAAPAEALPAALAAAPAAIQRIGGELCAVVWPHTGFGHTFGRCRAHLDGYQSGCHRWCQTKRKEKLASR